MAIAAAQLPAHQVQNLGWLPLQRGFGLMVALAAIVSLIVGGWLWGQNPDYRVLYSNLSDRDGGAVIASLQQMNVPFKFSEGGGALLVPASQVHEVRLRLAGQGLPKGGLAGFELMETQKLGATQFQEQVNYQRALEGELARSIQTMSAVAGARVHLAFSKQSVFVREQQKPSASVLLSLHPGRSLEAGQISAIVHLVSSSIPDLPVKNVTVVDQSGNLLTAQAGNNVGLDPNQLKYRLDVEQSFAKRIEAILLPITGPGNVQAQVTADIDFSQVENIAETYSPNQTAPAAMRSQQTSEASGNAGVTAGGVPGALSNQPPGNASAPITAASGALPGAPAATAAPGNSRRDSTVNYEVDKTVRHVRQQVGVIKRLSVAVVVNHRKVVDSAGKAGTKALAAPEIEQINALVKEVMGYSKERGDTLNVANSAFSAPEAVAAAEVPMWKQPDNIAMAKEIGKNLLIAAIVLFLVLGVLRPLLNKLSEPMRVSPALQAAGADDAEPAAAGAPGRIGYEQDLEAAKQLARSEPKLVANVLKDWLAGNE